jgi:hypothetical protein
VLANDEQIELGTRAFVGQSGALCHAPISESSRIVGG